MNYKQQAKDKALALHNWNTARNAAVRTGDKTTVAELDASPVETTVYLPDNHYIYAICTSAVKGKYMFFYQGKRVTEPKLDSMLAKLALTWGAK